MMGAQKSRTDEDVAWQWWLNFQRGYYKGTADPYRGLVWTAGEKYYGLLQQGASPRELELARESLLCYWEKWKISAIEHVQDGLKLFLELTMASVSEGPEQNNDDTTISQTVGP